jgi:hypothetical protein
MRVKNKIASLVEHKKSFQSALSGCELTKLMGMDLLADEGLRQFSIFSSSSGLFMDILPKCKLLKEFEE